MFVLLFYVRVRAKSLFFLFLVFRVFCSSPNRVCCCYCCWCVSVMVLVLFDGVVAVVGYQRFGCSVGVLC